VSSWCDKLASTPTVGFVLDWHFATRDELLQSIAPLLSKHVVEGKPKFTIQPTDATVAAVNTDAGYHFSIDGTKIAVAFQHMVRAKPVSGSLPMLEMMSRPLPFTELLTLLRSTLVEATLLLPGAQSRKITRVGIVSNTVVADDEMPPGVDRFVKYVSKPWGDVINGYSLQVVGKIGETEGSSDRCIHTIVRSEEDPDGLVRITLDWQRTFDPGRAISSETIDEVLRTAEASALRYFEDVGEGERFDESVVDTSVSV
jgi:hypothetical protein